MLAGPKGSSSGKEFSTLPRTVVGLAGDVAALASLFGPFRAQFGKNLAGKLLKGPALGSGGVIFVVASGGRSEASRFAVGSRMHRRSR